MENNIKGTSKDKERDLRIGAFDDRKTDERTGIKILSGGETALHRTSHSLRSE